MRPEYKQYQRQGTGVARSGLAVRCDKEFRKSSPFNEQTKRKPVIFLDLIQHPGGVTERRLSDRVRPIAARPTPVDCISFVNANDLRLESVVGYSDLDVPPGVDNDRQRKTPLTTTEQLNCIQLTTPACKICIHLHSEFGY